MEYSRPCRERTIRMQRESWLGCALRRSHPRPSEYDPVTLLTPRCAPSMPGDLAPAAVSFPQPSFHNSFDVVLSDMAPSTSGIKMLDANSSHELCQHALDIAHKVLKPNGTLIMVGQENEGSDAGMPGLQCCSLDQRC